MIDDIEVYTSEDGMAVLGVGDDGTGLYLHVDPDTGVACFHAREVTYRYRGDRSRKHTRSATVDAPVARMTRFLVHALHVLGVDLGPDVRPTVDEAAIRADERARVEADVLAQIDTQRKHVRTVCGFGHDWRDGGTAALDELGADIRAGKHRSTP